MDADVYMPFEMLDRLLRSASESAFARRPRIIWREEQMLMVQVGV
jgi:hypothetical protein